MSFGHTLKKLIIKLNDKLDDPNAKAWDPTLTGKAALTEHWRWTELAAKRGEWRKIIQRTDGWREREKEEAEANAAARRERRRATAQNRAPRAPQAGSGGYAAVPPPPPGDSSSSNARDAPLPLVTRHGNRRISSKEDTGTNPSIILHITRRTKPIIQLWRFVSVFQ